MKKIGEAIKKDFWVILLDIIAVNLSYFLAIFIRFFVNSTLRPIAVDRYMPAFVGFIPWYTVIAIVVFFAWKLYGGLWRYAGVNDMNRIIFANLCTTIIYVAGSCLFFTRMPITIYIIGGILQFVFIVSIRFAYRVLLIEKKKVRSRGLSRIDCVVIGSGENGRRVIKNLEETDNYRPVAVVGTGTGTMDGVPIIGPESVEWKNIRAVFIADPLLSFSDREKIRRKTEEAGVELHDYTGYFSNLGGNLSLTELLAVIHTPVTIELYGKEKEFENGEQAISELTEKYSIVEVDAKKIRLKQGEKLNKQDILAQAYAAMIGDESPQGGSK